MAQQKCERPPGILEAAAAVTDRCSERRQNTASPTRPQQLARVEIEYGAVEVLESPDAPGGFAVRTLVRWSDDDTWQPFGQSWAAPVYLLDVTIEALQRAREAIAGAQH